MEPTYNWTVNLLHSSLLQTVDELNRRRVEGTSKRNPKQAPYVTSTEYHSLRQSVVDNTRPYDLARGKILETGPRT